MRLSLLGLGLFVLGSLTPLPAHSQFVMDHDRTGGRLRGLHGPMASAIKRSFESDKEAIAIFREILSATGIPGVAERILVRASADVPNAEALIGEDGKRYILYNATFMQELQSKTRKYWSQVFVVAHEVGHHIAGHLDFDGQNHQVELEADRFAGFILGRMGASHDDGLAAARMVGTEKETETHPSRDQRVQAVSLGWSDGQDRQRPPLSDTAMRRHEEERRNQSADADVRKPRVVPNSEDKNRLPEGGLLEQGTLVPTSTTTAFPAPDAEALRTIGDLVRLGVTVREAQRARERRAVRLDPPIATDARNAPGRPSDVEKRTAPPKAPVGGEKTKQAESKVRASPESCAQMARQYEAQVLRVGPVGTLAPALGTYQYLQCNCGYPPSPHIPACPK